MCGRFSLDKKAEAVKARFKVKLNLESASKLPLFNIAPGQEAACIAGEELHFFEWGLAGKGVDGKSRNLINARSETILEKWPFKSLMQNRCMVLASGFFEWKTFGKIKIPFLHQLADGEMFGIAALYEKEPDSSQTRFTLLTKAAGPACSELHDRMPMILNPEQEKIWLDGRKMEWNTLDKLIKVKEPELKIFSVSPRLNKSFENDPALLQPTPYTVVEQLSLF